MSKYASKDVGFMLLGGYSVLGATSKIEDTVSLNLNETPALGEADESYWSSGAKKTEVTQDGWFDDSVGSIHDSLVGLPVTALPMSIAPHGNVKGRMFDGYPSVQRVGYTKQIAVGDVQKAQGKYGIYYGKRVGTIVHELATESTAGNSDGAYVDLGVAGPGNGGGIFVHITAAGGTAAPTNITIGLRHSATSGSGYAAKIDTGVILFTAIPATSGLWVPFSGALNRYVSASWAYTGGTAPTVTFALGVYVAP